MQRSQGEQQKNAFTKYVVGDFYTEIIHWAVSSSSNVVKRITIWYIKGLPGDVTRIQLYAYYGIYIKEGLKMGFGLIGSGSADIESSSGAG